MKRTLTLITALLVTTMVASADETITSGSLTLSAGFVDTFESVSGDGAFALASGMSCLAIATDDAL